MLRDMSRSFIPRGGPESLSIKEVLMANPTPASLRSVSGRPDQKNVYPDAPMPYKHHYVGHIRASYANKCLEALGTVKGAPKVETNYCHGLGHHQAWIVTRQGTIQYSNYCIGRNRGLIGLNICTGSHNQVWRYQAGQIIHQDSGLCLRFVGRAQARPRSLVSYLSSMARDLMDTEQGLDLAECDQSEQQRWELDGPVQWN